MKQTFKIRWNGHRIRVEFTKLGFMCGGQGQAPRLIIKTSLSAADRLSLPRVQRYKVNPDIIETIGSPASYAKKLLGDLSGKIQHRRKAQITQQMPLFGAI